jgi:hypothetical protein
MIVFERGASRGRSARAPAPIGQEAQPAAAGVSCEAAEAITATPAAKPAGHAGGLFIDADDLPVSLAAKLNFAGPSVETLNAYRR